MEHFWSSKDDELCCHTHEVNLIFKINVSKIDELVEITQMEEHVAFKWINLEKLDTTYIRPPKLKLLLPEWLKCNLNDALKTSVI